MQLEEEAQTILNRLSLMPFDECYPLSREFRNMPAVGGLYAVRHRAEGILYIGLAVSLRRRFRDNGHKAFFWAFLDCYSPFDIRIAVELLTIQSFREGDRLETLMIRSAQPRYNVRKKREE
ncbi:GIY-YIG nuclease family protein [Leptolyngbya boryana CZ1]|jgi:excinuclease UvrABC nuclease subunit|uniref:Excinuclease ABC subunit C n=2 Tax=Leptolyngbya boryana TaxID=1184 RepID=A0A1Z4JPF0_LEPBY|nr:MULTISPECIES: GIY-YIG nuclease family protein [Leptolyngbya]BAY58596.1 excinuclease ABC subunit C [Leptolyngbya boryana NIES-2135]MBD1858851.1 GIY-YIG nuclease family protein [Leptolyngbya sp. FACHB-1624]MBD2370728.1 GIY-YIG nuclease family protein [Leptolyngbya sp. FACHB-161]MBD2377119.1 GIY-YIG nuclease family protein [Leptolyngbya sp. FACHB-238]MBD2401562.1 GIY-YIG nuclease family protein [Leptolyngbya sp. FACHB-239]